MAFIDGKMINDNLYHASPWYIGIKRFVPDILNKEFYLYFRPIYKDAPFLKDIPKDKLPDLSKGPVVDIKAIKAIPEYKVLIKKN